MTVSAVVLIAALAQGPAQQQSSPALVEGIVIRQGSGEALSGATVELAGRGVGVYTASTGADGRFRFENVAPGTYRLRAARSGFGPADYGQRSPGGPGVSLQLAAGQKMVSIQLAMAATGAIIGHVYDTDGEPVARAQVQALRSIYREGRRQLTIAQAVESNDRGEYRLHSLVPGQYYVAAKPDQPFVDSGIPMFRVARAGDHEEGRGPFVQSRTSDDGAAVEEVYRAVYYPGSTDTQSAVLVAVGSGANVSGVDIPVGGGLVRTRRIQGFATNATNGQPLTGASVLAIPRTLDPNVVIPNGRVAADGSFDLSGVTPGSYIVFASIAGLTGGVAVDVGDVDVQGLAITATQGFRISGRFVIAGGSRDQAALRMADLRATIARDPDIVGMPSGGPTFSPPPSEDGSFVLEGVGVGDLRAGVRGLPKGAYVKSMRMGAVDVLDGGLHVFGASRDALEIVIGTDGGAIAGRVAGAAAEPLVNRTVVAVPDAALRHRADLFKSTSTDTAGRFRLEGLSPGEYKVFAWEIIEAGAWQDPDVLRDYENRGRTIRVGEASDQNVD